MTEPVRTLTPEQEAEVARLQHVQHLLREVRDYARMALAEYPCGELEMAECLLKVVAGRVSDGLFAIPMPLPIIPGLPPCVTRDGGAATGVGPNPPSPDASPPAETS